MEVYRGGFGEMGKWIVTEGMVVEAGEWIDEYNVVDVVKCGDGMYS